MPTCKQGSTVLFPGTPAQTTVTTTRRMDPDWEAQDIAETEHSNLSPQELDALRCKAIGVPYVSPVQAQNEERLRPQKKLAEEISVGQSIADALKQIANVRTTDGSASPDVAPSSGIGFIDPASTPAPMSRMVKIAEGEVADPIRERA